MISSTGSHPGSRLPLNRDRVLHAAITLADTGGIESLTMRRLGQQVGVEAMSLYNHVANKEEILSGIVELVMDEITLPARDADWKVALRASAISAHEVMLHHPWVCRLMMSPIRVGPAQLRRMEAMLRTLREAGFSADLTCHAYHALESHIVGFTLWVVSLPARGEELLDLAEEFLQELPVDEYPYVAEHIQQHLAPSTHDGVGEFEFGLDLILDSLERMRVTT